MLLDPNRSPANQLSRCRVNRIAPDREPQSPSGTSSGRFAGLPSSRFALPFDVNLGAGSDKLADDFRESLPGDNGVPFDALLPLAAAVFKSLVRGKAELGERCAAWRIPDLRVFTNVSYMTLFTLFGITVLL